MKHLPKVAILLMAGVAFGIGVAVASPLDEAGSVPEQRPTGATSATAGSMTFDQLSDFAEFPLYGLPNGLGDMSLTAARRVSPEVIAQASQENALVETIGNPVASAESRGHGVVPDFVSMIYGDCDASLTPCSAPLEIQIWRSCNRSLDDYELAPDVPYPHNDLSLRGTAAAEFDDRVELYAGSVTIVIFAEKDLAMRATEQLQPLNGEAQREYSERGAELLPASKPGAECA